MLIVVKVGGDLVKDHLPDGLLQDLLELKKNHRIILVHGGADIVTEVSTKMGQPPRFVVSPKGFRSRYTDADEMKIYAMVMAGLINKTVVALLEGSGISAVGLSGADNHLIRAMRKSQLIIKDNDGKKKLIDGGFTGKITEINTHFLFNLLEQGILPVICPIAIGQQNELLNVDGDRVASSIASSLKADRLVLLTDTLGVKLDGEFVSHLNFYEAESKLDDLTEGMKTKIYAASEAIRNGVKEVQISTGYSEEPITLALTHQKGTTISK